MDVVDEIREKINEIEEELNENMNIEVVKDD